MSFGCSALAVRPGEFLAQPLVFGPQPADLAVDGLQALPQRGVGGALSSRDRRPSTAWLGAALELLDLGAQVGLAVEPRAGDALLTELASV